MNKLNKGLKILLLLITVPSIVIIIFIVSKKENPTTPEKQFISPPKIENYFGDELKINQNLERKDFDDFPKSLPYLKQLKNSPFTPQEMSTIALSLGFNKTPIEITDVKNGKLYIWNNDEHSLFIYSQIRKIKYAPATNPVENINNSIDKQMTNEDYQKLALIFFSNKLNLNKDRLKFSNYVYLKPEQGLELYKETDKDKAKITQLNFSYSDSEHPIYTTNAQDAQIYIQFTKDGEVLNMEASLFSEYKPSEIEYKIKDYNEFMSTLNKSVLVNINSSNVNLPDIKSKDFSDILIKEVYLVYLQDSLDSEILQPTFLLKGSLTMNSNRLDASFFLPAYSEN